MKGGRVNRRELVRMLADAGFVLVPSGHTASHDKYRRGSVTVMVPRHEPVNKWTVRKILRDAGLL